MNVSWPAISMQFKDQSILYKLQSFSICTWKGGWVYSKINEVLLHYYFLLQCTLKRHINITPHPLHKQAYFSPKIFHSEHSYSNQRLLILREIFHRVSSKTGNNRSFEMFWSFVLLFSQKPFFYFFYLTKEIIWM